MDEVQKVFNKFNTNGNGRISVSELRSVFRDLGLDASTSSADLTDAATVIDKDGAIDLHEFADFHRGNASTHGGQNSLFKGNN
ncbi:hypothetical protein RHGRI_020653 [Rhododendron griersonianum]|uniref:EF-hand domain-containing protein n=1 Tax=Rhododendron griersonianum TaxID=479676 RepID=A0AAV6JMF2_9ERIC|nr:hypothetical protein RHGRI_020653 [Rhododendron griersonianum]